MANKLQTIISIFVLIVTYAIGGCCTTDPQLRLGIFQEKGKVTLEWEFDNTTNQALWISPSFSWEPHEVIYSGPFAYIAPPCDLMLVCGNYLTDVREGRLLELTSPPTFEKKKLLPGEKTRGKIYLQIPYRDQTIESLSYYYMIIANHYEPPYETTGSGSYCSIKEIKGVQAAFKYWIEEPDLNFRLSNSPPRTELCGYAMALLTGVKFHYFHQWDCVARMAISNRISCRIPLAKEVKLYYRN